MTPEEFRDRMAAIRDGNAAAADKGFSHPEYAHDSMDELLCEALRNLGYGEGVQIFEDQPKWYN